MRRNSRHILFFFLCSPIPCIVVSAAIFFSLHHPQQNNWLELTNHFAVSAHFFGCLLSFFFFCLLQERKRFSVLLLGLPPPEQKNRQGWLLSVKGMPEHICISQWKKRGFGDEEREKRKFSWYSRLCEGSCWRIFADSASIASIDWEWKYYFSDVGSIVCIELSFRLCYGLFLCILLEKYRKK